MTIKIGINGFGRIGRLVYRIAAGRPDVHVVAIRRRRSDRRVEPTEPDISKKVPVALHFLGEEPATAKAKSRRRRHLPAQ